MPHRRFFQLSLLLCSGGAFLLYGPVLTSFFILDDFVWLDCARETTTGSPWHVFNRHINYFFRPVVHGLFALLFGAFGPSPPAFHAAVLALHGLAAAMLCLLCLRLTRRPWPAAATGAVFILLHPIYKEAMVWVSAAAEPLLVIFGALAALAWHRALHRETGGRLRHMLVAWAAYVLALCCKETAVVVWPLLVVLEIALRRTGRTWRISPLAHLPFALALVAYLGLQLMVQHQNPLVRSGMYSFGSHAAVVLSNSAYYLTLEAWPALAAVLLLGLLARRGGAGAHAPGRVILLSAAAVIAGVGLAMLPYIWFQAEVMPSRYFYLSAAVLSLGIGAALAAVRLDHRWLAPALVGAALCVMAIPGFLTSRRELIRYQQVTIPVERFVHELATLRLDGHTLVLGSPLRGLHVRGAFYVFHPDHPRTVWGTHRKMLPRKWGKKRALRWDPVSGHFRRVQ